MKQPQTNPPTFDDVITALLDPTTPFPAKFLHRFSDISPEDLDSVKNIWEKVDCERRANLLDDLEKISDQDTLVSFEDLARFTLKDPDARVRSTAIRLLWDAGDSSLAYDLIELSKTDVSELVRAAAASGLGYYVYLGEMEEITEMLLDKVINHLMVLLTSKDTPLVRRRALEALGYRSDDEIDDHIRSAYKSDDSDWIMSALFAMGRSANPKWGRMVLEMFVHPNTQVRAEAVRAAGELELAEARDPLLILLEEPEELDEEVFFNAVWALSKIGGQGVRKRLEEIIDAADEDMAELLEDSLDNLEFTETFNRTMFEFEVELDGLEGETDDLPFEFDLLETDDEQETEKPRITRKDGRKTKKKT
ncbi:MAG: HEAT repeat domain-containing protein [Anaerolineae bacterium]|jgi:HEAT repeat protein|nr:HEAT repeat domain-containing protein [Anaerolineae bacterium]